MFECYVFNCSFYDLLTFEHFFSRSWQGHSLIVIEAMTPYLMILVLVEGDQMEEEELVLVIWEVVTG